MLVALVLLMLGGCATAPPRHPDNICQVFNQYPQWYDDAAAAQQRWGTPISVLMSFVRRESSYREDARPKRPWFFFIPLPRNSSAYGYAQIQDPAWHDYLKANGGWFKSRSDMGDALDFVGWYTDKSQKLAGISKWDPYNQYLAYHEGQGGWLRKSYRHNRKLKETARRVDYRAREWGAQLRGCEDDLDDGWWIF